MHFGAPCNCTCVVGCAGLAATHFPGPHCQIHSSSSSTCAGPQLLVHLLCAQGCKAKISTSRGTSWQLKLPDSLQVPLCMCRWCLISLIMAVLIGLAWLLNCSKLLYHPKMMVHQAGHYAVLVRVHARQVTLCSTCVVYNQPGQVGNMDVESN